MKQRRQDWHLVVTGAPGAGKTTVCGRCADRFGARVLDVRRFYPSTPTFSPTERKTAFAKYEAALALSLANDQPVVSEGFFFSPERRASVEEITASASRRLIVVTLTAPDDVLFRRVAERAKGQGADVPEPEIRRFAAVFRDSPWGVVIDTSTKSPEDTCSQIEALVNA